jgi:hypothetical protein
MGSSPLGSAIYFNHIAKIASNQEFASPIFLQSAGGQGAPGLIAAWMLSWQASKGHDGQVTKKSPNLGDLSGCSLREFEGAAAGLAACTHF